MYNKDKSQGREKRVSLSEFYGKYEHALKEYEEKGETVDPCN